MRRLQSDCAYEHLTYGFGEIVTAMKLQELFTSEDTFTRGAFARDGDGNPCPARSPEAVAWDLDGAIQKCYETPLAVIRVLEKLQSGHVVATLPHSLLDARSQNFCA
jgi:hypothetical protein